jgi:hypothetical protein
MLIPLLMLTLHTSTIPAATNLTAPTDPPVHVWLSSDGNYHFGDRAKVYAKAAKDGYLVVLRADVHGRVWPVFPVDPKDDQHVQGGKKYELKGRGGREAFVVGNTPGQGMVLAAYSATPFHFDQFATGGHWNTAALSGRDTTYSANASDQADPEARLRDLVQQMQSDVEHFDYDFVTYVVAREPRYAAGPYPGPYVYGYPGWWGWGYYGWGAPLYVGPRVFVGPPVFVGPRVYLGPRFRRR